MQNFILTAFIICISATTAFAQQREYKGGINYTNLTATKSQAAEEAKPPLYNRAPSEQTATKDTPVENALPGAPTGTAKENKSSPDAIWDKYKELAAGKSGEDKQENTAPQKPSKPSAPEKTAQANQAPQSPSGIAGIISDYRKNKEKRSQMRSIRMNAPQRPSTQTPTVSAPQVAVPNVEKPQVAQ